MSKCRELSKLPNYVLSTVAELKLAVGKEQGDKAFIGGYYADGDGGGGDFYWDTVSVEADNGGTIFQVTGTTTGRWKRIYSGSVSVKWFGAKGDWNGTTGTDDTSAFQNAINSLGAKGGVIMYDGKHLMDSALTINKSIAIKGSYIMPGVATSNAIANYADMSALIINPLITISVAGGAGLDGCLLYRKAMVFPSLDSSLFSGVPITFIGDDCFVTRSMILGFTQAIYSNGKQRPRVLDVYLDNTNGVHINACYDIAYISRVHSWPFATIGALGNAASLQRAGTAIHFSNGGDWNKITDCFSYAYSRGIHIEACNSVTVQGCGADSTGGFAGQIGFMVTGNSEDTRLINCQSAAQEAGYYISTADGVQTRMTGCDSWACTPHGVLVDVAGDVKIQGGIHRNTGNAITLNNTLSKVYVNGIRTKAISSAIFNITVATTGLTIGEDNDYGDWSNGASITNNSTHVIQSIASADPLNLQATGDSFIVSGATSFGTLNGGWKDRAVTFYFSGILSIFSSTGSSKAIRLNNSVAFTSAVGSTLTLRHNGVQWYEVGRSV